MLICIIFASLILICGFFCVLFSFPTNRKILRLRVEQNRLQDMKYQAMTQFGSYSPEYEQAKQAYDKAYDIYREALERGTARANVRTWFIGLAVCFAVIFAIMGLAVLFEHSTLVTTQRRINLQETYDSLRYQIDNLAYQDELNLNDQLVFSNIQEWNQMIKIEQYKLQNPWVSWFHNPVYNEFSTIDYNMVVIKSGG